MFIATILAASGRGADTTLVTTLHLALIAVAMAAAVAVIVWGAVQKRRRAAAEHRSDERQEELEAHAPIAPIAPQPGAGPGSADRALTDIKGLGAKAAATLAEHGVAGVAALAALSPDAAAELDAKLGAFAGRLARDRWVEQAQLLAAGDIAGFEAKFGRL